MMVAVTFISFSKDRRKFLTVSLITIVHIPISCLESNWQCVILFSTPTWCLWSETWSAFLCTSFPCEHHLVAALFPMENASWSWSWAWTISSSRKSSTCPLQVWFGFCLLQHCLLLMSRTHPSSTFVSAPSLGAAALRSPTTAFPAAARALLYSQTLGIRS